MTRNINLPDQSWSFQPSCPLGPSSGNLPSWSNANNGFGNQAIFQQPVHPLPVQIAYPSAGLIGTFTNNTSLQQGLQQVVPIQGPHVVGLAQPQGISMNFSQNFNAQNFNAQNFNAQNFNAQNFDTQNFNAQNYNAQNFDTQNFNAQNFNTQNFVNIPLDTNSLPAFNIQQNANGNPGTSAFQNISSDCIPISQDMLQRVSLPTLFRSVPDLPGTIKDKLELPASDFAWDVGANWPTVQCGVIRASKTFRMACHHPDTASSAGDLLPDQRASSAQAT
ncbi:Ff.00g112800.m01.CDS01 [Fusarium sp. VM40]|nr:Ff.00g112800.m01.CDS01 [Fusarium sp. VM40]